MTRRSISFAILSIFVCVAQALAVSCPTPIFEESGYGTDLNLYGRVASVDFDHNGLADSAHIGPVRAVVLFSTGDGTQFQVILDAPGWTSFVFFSDLAVADFNADGHPDIAATDYGEGRLAVWMGNGDRTFDAAVVTTLDNFFPRRIAAGDFNSDGVPDLALTSWERSVVAIRAGDGTGQFSELTTIAIAAPQTTSLLAADLDADGWMDFVLGNESASTLEVRYGRGDGTFETAITPAAGRGTDRIVAVDFNGDSELDLLSASRIEATLTVNLNNGSRAFGVTTYTTRQDPTSYSSPSDLSVGDFNNDGALDVVIAARSTYLPVFPGNGDGTLGPALFIPIYSWVTPTRVVALPLRGAQKLDLVISDDLYGNVTIILNRCGDSKVTAITKRPVISVGQSTLIHVTLAPYALSLPTPTGVVRILDGGVQVGSGTIAGGQLTVEVNGLTAGDHNLVAAYDGDSSFDPRLSTAVLQRVTTHTTTTTLSAPAPANPSYGDNVNFSVTVTSTSNTVPNGSYTLIVDGQRRPAQYVGYGSTVTLSVGTHAISAEYAGDWALPPSTSATLSLDASKYKPSLSVGVSNWPPLAGQTISVQVGNSVRGPSPGNVTLLNGVTALATDPITSYSNNFVLAGRAAGVYYFSASYGGNENNEPAVTPTMKLTIFPGGTFATHTTVGPDTIGVFGVLPPGPSPTFMLYRRSPGEEFAQKQTNWSANFTDYYAVRGMLYIYQVRQVDSASNMVVNSTPDAALFTQFTDQSLFPGGVVKAIHVAELVAAVNSFRIQAGLTALPVPVPVAGDPIQSSHLQSLRDGLNAARIAIGVPAVGFLDNPLTAGTPIRATHIQQLRDAIQ